MTSLIPLLYYDVTNPSIMTSLIPLLYYDVTGQYDLAANFFLQAYALDPSLLVAANNYAVCLLYSGKHKAVCYYLFHCDITKYLLRLYPAYLLLLYPAYLLLLYPAYLLRLYPAYSTLIPRIFTFSYSGYRLCHLFSLYIYIYIYIICMYRILRLWHTWKPFPARARVFTKI